MTAEDDLILEQIRRGLSPAEIAKLIQTKRALDKQEREQETFASVKMLLAGDAAPTPAPKQLPTNGNGHKPALKYGEMSVKELLEQLVSDEDFATAPLGTQWKIPVIACQMATKSCHTKGLIRSNQHTSSAIANALKSRNMVARVSCRIRDTHATVTKVTTRKAGPAPGGY